MRLRLAALCLLALSAACQRPTEEEPPTWDDSAERGTFVEGRGFSYVGFVPITSAGIDNQAFATPKAFTVRGTVPGVVIEYERLLQQGWNVVTLAGFFSNGFVPGPDVSLGEPNISAGTRVGDVRTGYWFTSGSVMGHTAMMLLPTSDPKQPYLATRQAGRAQARFNVAPEDVYLDDVDWTPEVDAKTYAFRLYDRLGVVTLGTGGTTRLERLTPSGGALGLSLAGGAVQLANLGLAPDGGAVLELYHGDDGGLALAAQRGVPAEVRVGRPRVLSAGGETWVAIERKETLAVYHLEGGSLEEVPLPAGTERTVAIDSSGALYFGFSDTAEGGRASVQKRMGGVSTPVGQPGLSASAVPAYVFPHGDDVYVAFPSRTPPLGVTLACHGPTCVPYVKKTVAAPPQGVISCAHGGDMCREARGTSPAGFDEFRSWCADQSGGVSREAPCATEGLVGGCRKTYDGVEDTFWSYGTYGKTQAMVERSCGLTSTEFVPPP